MSRSGYSEDCDNLGLYRQAVDRAISGKRGQAFLREMAEALDAMPVKELAADVLVQNSTQVCALGAVALARHLDVSHLDIEDGGAIGAAFGIARTLACEIAYHNDEAGPWNRLETPAERWTRMRSWVWRHIVDVERRGIVHEGDRSTHAKENGK